MSDQSGYDPRRDPNAPPEDPTAPSGFSFPGYGEEPPRESGPNFSLPNPDQAPGGAYGPPGPPPAQPPGYDSGYGANPPAPYGPTSGPPGAYDPTSGVPGAYGPTSGPPTPTYGTGGYPPVSGAPGYGPDSGPPAYGAPGQVAGYGAAPAGYGAPQAGYAAGYGPPPGGPAYGAAAYGTDAFGMPTKPGTEPMANVSMGVGIGSVVLALFGCCCWPIGIVGSIAGVVAAILGFISRGRIAEAGGRLGGRNQSQTGIITGFVGVGLGIILVVLALVLGFGQALLGA